MHNFGVNNTFLGINAGNFTMTGAGNVGIGIGSFQSNTGGDQNTAVGQTTLFANTTGAANTAFGFRALEANTIGVANTGVGQGSLLVNTTGINNTAIGAHSLESNTTGQGNVAAGFAALGLSRTGDNNTSIGINTLLPLTIGSGNTALGANAGLLVGGTSNNNIYINNLGAVENATIRIGTSPTQQRCFIAGIRGVMTGIADTIPVLIDSAGQLGTVSSSQAVKHNIHDMDNASSAIYQLRPVTFVYNGDETETIQYGLIAEEVDTVFPDIVVNNRAGKPETVQYHVLPVLLLNEMKKQHATIDQMGSIMTNLQQQTRSFIAQQRSTDENFASIISAMAAKIADLENRISARA